MKSESKNLLTVQVTSYSTRHLAEGLAARGHNLTILSPDVDKKVLPNVHYIHLEEIYSHYYKWVDQVDLEFRIDQK